jgi:hypothetical protein
MSGSIYGQVPSVRKTMTVDVRYTADEWITGVLIQRDGRWVSVLSQKCPVET